MTLTTKQREVYDCDGLVALRGAVPAGDVAAMSDALWRELERRGIRREARETWPRAPAELLQTGFASVGKSGAFAGMASPAVLGAVDDLLGPGWVQPSRWGLPLVTFPDDSAEWDVPRANWHLDGPVSAEAPAIARVFLILAPLAPKGGGTIVALGSHRLMLKIAQRAGGTLKSADAIRRLRTEHPWFTSMMSTTDRHDRVRRFMEEGVAAEGVHVRIAEMTGEPGDVLLMHPSMLHAASPNVTRQPRMMLTQFIAGAGQAATAPAGMGPM